VLAEPGHGAGVGTVGDAVVVVQFAAELVDDFLVVGHLLGAPAFRNRLNHLVRQTSGARVRGVHVPLVLLGPAARLQDDRELAERARQCVAEAEISAHLRGVDHQLRAAAERHERTEDLLHALDAKFGGGLLLRLGLSFGRDRGEAVLRVRRGGQRRQQQTRQAARTVGREDIRTPSKVCSSRL
jgi:hypothetical protein